MREFYPLPVKVLNQGKMESYVLTWGMILWNVPFDKLTRGNFWHYIKQDIERHKSMVSERMKCEFYSTVIGSVVWQIIYFLPKSISLSEKWYYKNTHLIMLLRWNALIYRNQLVHVQAHSIISTKNLCNMLAYLFSKVYNSDITLGAHMKTCTEKERREREGSWQGHLLLETL